MTHHIMNSVINGCVRRTVGLRKYIQNQHPKKRRMTWSDGKRANRMSTVFLVAVLVVPLLSMNGYAAPLAYNENISGDLLGGFNPLGVLDVGVNTVTGSITGGVDGGDRWDLELPAGLEIYQIDW